MRRNGIFWGIIVIILGLSLLLQNLGLLPGNFWLVFWPLVLIVFGAYILIGPTLFHRTIAVENHSFPIDNATSAAVVIQHGAGRLSLDCNAEAGALINGSFAGGVESQLNHSGAETQLRLRPPADMFVNVPWGLVDHGFDWSLHLAKDIPMRITFDTGASESDLDLREAKISRVDLDSGASKTRIIFPSQAGFTEAHIKTGAASLELVFPEGVAGRLRVHSGLSNIMIDPARFPFNGSYYETPGFSTALNRIDIEIETGVGRIEAH
jgi:hypothetical protein